eukprot:1117490_1
MWRNGKIKDEMHCCDQFDQRKQFQLNGYNHSHSHSYNVNEQSNGPPRISLIKTQAITWATCMTATLIDPSNLNSHGPNNSHPMKPNKQPHNNKRDLRPRLHESYAIPPRSHQHMMSPIKMRNKMHHPV